MSRAGNTGPSEELFLALEHHPPTPAPGTGMLPGSPDFLPCSQRALCTYSSCPQLSLRALWTHVSCFTALFQLHVSCSSYNCSEESLSLSSSSCVAEKRLPKAQFYVASKSLFFLVLTQRAWTYSWILSSVKD